MPLIIAICPACGGDVTAVVCPREGEQYARPCNDRVVATIADDRLMLEVAS